MTNKEPVQLRIHLEDWDGNRTAIVVNEFKISNEQHGYRIFYKNFKVYYFNAFNASSIVAERSIEIG